MIWKWANGKLDLIKSVEARKELYEKAHDPNTRASEKLEVSKCAIIKFGERHPKLLEEMKQHATYESYKNSDSYKRWVIDDNNNFITEENNETATRKRLSTTDSLQDCEPSTSACTTKRSRQSPG